MVLPKKKTQLFLEQLCLCAQFLTVVLRFSNETQEPSKCGIKHKDP